MDAKEQINKIKEALGLQKTEKTINLAQIAKVNKWYIEVEGDTFAVGNKVIRKWWDNETEPLEAGEYELINGAKMMVDSSGIITTLEGNEINLNKNNMTEKEFELKLSEQKEANEKLIVEMEAANKKIVELSEELATKKEAKEEKPKEEVSTDPKENEVVMSEIEKLKIELEELKKQPVREVELKEEDLSFAELQVLRDKQYNEKK